MVIAVTGRNFDIPNREAIELLEKAGHTVRCANNPNIGTGAASEVVSTAIGDADVVIAGLEPINAEVLDKCPNLKLVSRRGIGYDAVDLEECRKRGIGVIRTVGAVEAAVAEHVLAYILYFARRIDLQTQSMHEGKWVRMNLPGAKSRVLGLVGFGGIGKEIAVRAVACGMEVVYYCRHPQPEWEEQYHVKYMPLDKLLAVSDYVSANVPLTEATTRMFDEPVFAKMKQGSIFINIARGKVMDDVALQRAVASGHLAGAAVDVFDYEPCTDSVLLSCPNIVLTPHTASLTQENFCTMNILAAQNVLAYLAGTIDKKHVLVQF